MFLSEGKLLNESDLTLLHAYTLKVEDGITNATFNKFRFAFPQAPLNSIKSTEKQVQFLSGFQPVRYSLQLIHTTHLRFHSAIMHRSSNKQR